MTADASQIRCDYSKKCEDLINLQINEELKAHYAYMSMASKNYGDAESLTPLSAMKKGIQMEMDIYYSLKKIHNIACMDGDGVLSSMLEEMLQEQVASMKEFGDFVTNLSRVGPGLGEYKIDHHLNKKNS
ncbi:hypothetical protein MXB_4722 [Myxobolus squamalis]|nr:hypothetical protein MXB_4722 [Myxobolus squamalis]